MAILDIFKKKKIKKKESEKAWRVQMGEEKKKEPEKKKIKPQVGRPQKISSLAYRVLKEPQITEKATNLTHQNQYVFKVFPQTNKVEIKRAIEDLYGVEVKSVRIIKIPRKRRRLGRIEGWRKGYKKAIVKVKEGQKIEILPR